MSNDPARGRVRTVEGDAVDLDSVVDPGLGDVVLAGEYPPLLSLLISGLTLPSAATARAIIT